MISFVKWCIKAGVAALISVVLLSMFTLIYSNSGIHIANPTFATDYCWEPKQFKANMSEGFSWLRMDAAGFNNKDDFSGDVEILLMGSSHMEAVNVAEDENVGVILNQLLPQYDTYNIGISGHTIYHCVNNIENAVKEYKSSQYIVIETDKIDLDENDMKSVFNGEYPHIPSYDSGLLYKIQKLIPAVLPIYRQLMNWKDASVSDKSSGIPGIQNGDVGLEYTFNEFLGYLKKSCGNRDVIIVYHPTTEIDGEGHYMTDSSDVDRFERACEQNEIYFLNMEQDFKEMYEDKKILAHGFSNTAVGKGHLNKYGHALIAERITETIKEIEHVTE